LAAAAIALTTAGASGQTECGGRAATIVGTPGADLLRGTPDQDVIAAGEGDDAVFGLGGADLVCGEGGADTILGGDAGDRLFGDPGRDFLAGGRGNDRLDGGEGDGDIARGDFGDDRVDGGPGRGDEVGGDLGIDRVDGGAGAGDLVHGDYGDDHMIGGPGAHDIASFAHAVAGNRGRGVNASLPAHKARGDGRDRLGQLEDIEGSPFADVLVGLGPVSAIDGGGGTDSCRGFGPGSGSCGRERMPAADARAELDPSPGGGEGLVLTSRAADAGLRVSYRQASGSFSIFSERGLAVGSGCVHAGSPRTATCAAQQPLRGVLVDLGGGDDRLALRAGLEAAGPVRVNGGPGDDRIRGGAEGDLIEAGLGADRLDGGAGSDALIGGLGGPDLLYGEGGSDVLAAGEGCGGGRLVGGGGRDNASFAETPAHPGVLIASLARRTAFVTTVRGCDPVRIAASAEDLEGSFDWDVLIGDGGPNSIFGQPGQDRFFGRGGDDVIGARDGEADFEIDCGPGADRAIGDEIDPPARSC
jgi:RTX calcium-binding nonapeptide repeat (4 copies)